MVSANRAFELIGLRVLLADTRQYISDAGKVEKANLDIAASATRLQASNRLNSQEITKTAQAINLLNTIQKAQVTSANALGAAYIRQTEALTKLEAAQRAVTAAGRITVVNGVSQPTTSQTAAANALTAAQAESTAATANVNAILAERSLRSKEVINLNKEIAASSVGVQAAAQTEAVRLEAIAAIEKELVINDRALKLANEQVAASFAEIAAAQELALTRKLPAGTPGNTGQFVSQASANESLAAAQAAGVANTEEANRALTKQQELQAQLITLQKESIVATEASALALGVESVEAERLAEAQAKLKEIQAARLKAAATATAIVGGAVAIGVTAATISTASNYQKELAKIQAQTNLTDADTKQLGQDLVKLSTQIPVSALDLAEAALLPLSGGIKNLADAENIATLAGEAQTAQLGKAANFAKVLVGVYNSYGDANIKSAAAADILTQGIKEGSATADDFVGGIGRLIGIAPNLNIKLSELVGTVAFLTNTSLGAEGSFTAVLGIMNELSQDTPQATKALASVGTSFEDIKKSIRDNGFAQTIIDLNKKFEDQGVSIRDVFPNIRAYNGFLAITNNEGKTLKQTIDNVQRANGSLKNSFDANKDTLSSTAQLFKNQINSALIKIGTDIIPEVTKALKSLATSFTNNKQEIIDFVETGIKALFDAIKSILTVIGALIEGFKAIGSAISAITGVAPGAAEALVAIGVALSWALRTSPYVTGLLLIVALLDKINGGGKPADTTRVRERLQQQQDNQTINVGGPVVRNIKGPQDIAVDNEIKRLKDLGITTVEDYDKYIAKQKELNDAVNNATSGANQSKVTEENLNRAIQTSNKAREEELAAVQKLKDAFVESSRAAGQVKNPVADLNLFGNVPQELAATFKDVGNAMEDLARRAGGVQALDAAASAIARMNSEAYNTQSTLSTVAGLFSLVSSGARGAASALQQLTVALAKSALEASQAAASALFGRPTQEVANANLQLARQQQANLPKQQSNDAQIKALQDQLKALDKQISQQQKADQAANQAQQKQQQAKDKAAQDAQKAQQKAQQDAQDAANRAAQAALDQLRISNLIAEQAAAREDENFQRLIDANLKSQSDLQANFLKSNDALQKQINLAVSKGDTQGALKLVDQQRAATKAYEEQAKGLKDSNDQLTIQQKAAQAAERERQRQAQLAEAYAQAQAAQIKSTQSNTDTTTDNSASTQDNTDKTIDSTTALEDQKTKIQDQIDSLTRSNDAMDTSTTKIQNQIDQYEAETKVLQALVTASDKTLLTQSEQAQAAHELAIQIANESSVIRKNANDILDLLPGDVGKRAKAAYDLLTDTIRVQVDPAFREQFLPNLQQAAKDLASLSPAVADANKSIADAAKAQAALVAEQAAAVTGAEQILLQTSTQYSQQLEGAASRVGSAAGAAAGKLSGLTSQTGAATGQLANFVTNLNTAASNLGSAVGKIISNLNNSSSGGSAKKNASGGFYSSPTNILIGETYQRELVLPLERPARARELLAQIPPSLAAAIRPSKAAQAIFAPNITVTGETLDAMEGAAIRAVHQAFRSARSSSVRAGGPLTSGLGPAALRS